MNPGTSPHESMGSYQHDVPKLTDHLFRHEAGKLVAVLTGIFGIDRLQLAEDVVQEAMVKALQTWPYYVVPRNPAAWLTQTAKNLALDALRREKTFREKQSQIVALIEAGRVAPSWKSDVLYRDMKLDVGAGIRVMFDKSIGRADVVVSDEGVSIIAMVGQTF